MKKERSFYFLSVKSFGDLMIPITCFKNEKSLYFTFIITPNLKELIEALQLPKNFNFIILKTEEKGVPSIFNIKRSRLIDSIKSLFLLKREIQKLNLNQFIYVDKLYFREKFILGSSGRTINKDLGNIYLSYYSLLGKKSAPEKFKGLMTNNKSKKIAIFPNTSRSKKNIHFKDIEYIVSLILKTGQTPIYYKFVEERELAIQGLITVEIERSFKKIISVMKKHGKAVCADSFPVHLREYLENGSFVIKNFENTAWIPSSVLKKGNFLLRKDLHIQHEKFLNYLLY